MKVIKSKFLLMFMVAIFASFFLLASGYAVGNFEKAHATKVYIDVGHGGSDSGAIGNGYQEKNLTADMARRVESAIKAKKYNIDTYVNIIGIPYYNRGSDAASKGCDMFVSLHMNSSGASSATGTESYIYKTASKRNAHSIDLQNAIHDRLVKATGLLNRGKKQEDFAVCRAPMPSVLLEMAFISNANDVRLFLLRRSAIANAIAEGIAAFAGGGLPKVYSSLDGSWAKENGKWCFKNKSGKKYTNSWLVTSIAPGAKSSGDYQRYYFDANGYFPSTGTHNINLVGKNSWFYFTSRGYVLRGFYDNGAARVFVADNDGRLAEPQNGERNADGSGWLITGKYTNGELQRYYVDGATNAVKSAIYEVDGATYFGQGGVGFCFRNGRLDWEGKSYLANNDGILIENCMIMGYSMTSVSQMVRRYNSMGVKYPSNVYSKYGASNITEFCKILMSEAKAEGVRAEVVFAQAMHETGWLKFGGDVKVDQCNFAGIGATGKGARGNSFNNYGANSVRMGLRAQIQHLKAYASTEPLKNATIDPRFQYVKRGCARTVYALGGRWATGSGYGTALMRQMNALLAS